MNSKERGIAALERRGSDRAPVGEMAIDFELTELALGRPTLYRSKWNGYSALWNRRRDEIVASYRRDVVDLVRHFRPQSSPQCPGAGPAGDVSAARVRRGVLEQVIEKRGPGRSHPPVAFLREGNATRRVGA